ncbi:sigma-54-dependent transcriptional regulator [Lentisalinibacter sediminis]|uniref:sigma-54-dependent transcriptional regulator n=1 Tax=Lentisalinibacter sediminis TaxID=2992237 RepID=UPI00386D270E
MSRPTSILLLGGARAEASRLRRALDRHFLLVEEAPDLDEARKLMRRCRFHRLVVVDPKESWSTLRRALDQCDGVPAEIFVIAGEDRAAMAIDALRGGASDVLLRPFPTDELVKVLAKPARRQASRNQRRGTGTAPRRLVGDSPSMQAVRSLIARVAPTRATVLIEGEAGAGKELVARLLHEGSGRRGPFVPVNCGAIASDLLESELFGHEPGAFTSADRKREGLFVAAGRGTLFLDEIDELPLDTEVKLLRALEEQTIRPVGSDREIPVDCRIVASTRSNLADLVATGRFREDLYYHLNVIRIEVPPLRERRQDIALLAAYFADRLAADMGLLVGAIEPAHLAAFEAHDWPGNVRELRNVVERTLHLGGLPPDSLEPGARPAEPPDYPLDWTLEQVKHHHMTRVLEASGGNKSAAARRLDISRKTLERKLGTSRHPQET